MFVGLDVERALDEVVEDVSMLYDFGLLERVNVVTLPGWCDAMMLVLKYSINQK